MPLPKEEIGKKIKYERYEREQAREGFDLWVNLKYSSVKIL